MNCGDKQKDLYFYRLLMKDFIKIVNTNIYRSIYILFSSLKVKYTKCLQKFSMTISVILL